MPSFIFCVFEKYLHLVRYLEIFKHVYWNMSSSKVCRYVFHIAFLSYNCLLTFAGSGILFCLKTKCCSCGGWRQRASKPYCTIIRFDIFFSYDKKKVWRKKMVFFLSFNIQVFISLLGLHQNRVSCWSLY